MEMATSSVGARPSGWVTGGVFFAATMLVIIGVFQALAGIAALANDEFFVVGRNYTFDLDVTGWGVIHLLLGLGIIAAGVALFQRRPWAALVGVAVAALSAVANFFFIPYYPWWSLLIIALDVWVIWALSREGAVDGYE
jgi:hypothetical protein